MPSLWVVIIAAIMIAVGAFLLYNIDRGLADNNLLKVVLPGILLVGLGIYLLFSGISVELLKRKAWGLGLFLFGIWFTFRFPDTAEHQPAAMGWMGFIIGIVSIVIGIWLVFF